MKETWHFKFPNTLLLPSVNRLAVQQGLSTLIKPNIEKLLILFQTFSAYSNLPFGLNPRRLHETRKTFQTLKQNPNTKISTIGAAIKKIKNIKENYQKIKTQARQNNLPIFIAYENEDLHFIAFKLLEKIDHYIKNAKKELQKQKLPSQKNHPIYLFGEFIKNTENLLKKHQSDVAYTMLLRLENADKNFTLHPLSEKDFIQFHRYIEQHGQKNALKSLSWIADGITTTCAITQAKKPRWPSWFFRSSNILHHAFSDSYRQASLSLEIKKLNTINNDNKRTKNSEHLETIQKIQKNITIEIIRIQQLKRKLFRVFYKKTRKMLTEHLQHLKFHQRQAKQLYKKIQTKIDFQKKEQQRKQKRRELIHQRVENYETETQSIKQIALLQKIHTATPNHFFELNQAIQQEGDSSTKTIWKHHLDHYRLNNFIKVVLNSEHSSVHLTNFLYALSQSNAPFPATEGVYKQLQQLIKHFPTPDWTEHQHRACETIDAHLILSNYYARALHCPTLIDLIIERFSNEQLTVIEFPELKKPLEKAIKKRLIEKEAQVTATLIQTEIDTGQIVAASDRLNRLQRNLQNQIQNKKQKETLIIVSEKLIKNAGNPEQLSKKIIKQLRKLLLQKTITPHYLERFTELKEKAETLPCSRPYLSIKRLCAAGPNIPELLNNLPNALLSFANGETENLALINPLLLDIIDADLLHTEKRNLLSQLIGAILLDPKANLTAHEKRRLSSVKKCLKGIGNQNDRMAFIQQVFLMQKRHPTDEYQLNTNKEGDQHESTIPYIP